MKPTDFPVERLSELESTFVGMADAQRRRARNAAAPPSQPNPNDPASEAPGTAIGYYESALAYYEAARATSIATNDIIADLDRAAAKEADSHAWPIAALDNIDDVLNFDRADQNRRRYPWWGVFVEGRSPEAWISAAPAVRGGANSTDEILLFVGDQFSDEQTAIGHPHPLKVDIAEWRALNQLVERIAAGKPIPYDTIGNTPTQEKAQ